MKNPLPQSLSDRLSVQFGPNSLAAMLKTFAKPRLPTFRVNTLKATDEQVMSVLREQAIAFERVKDIPHAFKIKNRTDKQLLEHELATSGQIYLQGLTSMLPPLLMDLKPTDTILDLCAAPGSKTSEIATLTNNQAKIIATEDNDIRYQKLLNTLNIQGATSVTARNLDAAQLYKELPEAFDKVLADVPCSAEGRIDFSDLRTYKYWSEKNIIAHAKLQRRLLKSAVACLKPGGTLVYSTCTLAPEENEGMVAWLINEFPFMQPVEIAIPLKNTRKTAHKTITLLPTDEAEGFFVAKLIKLKQA
ncbi:MAG: RsmB/NOP family class I SAM-dependent RNA methyltransferase [Patescibacteria group bacterium]